jgi:flagellar protein FlaG
MSSNPVAANGPPAVVPSTVPAAPSASPAAQKPPQQPDLDPANFQLVIEEDKAAGSFVYKTIDRRTGQVVSQLPREQILRLREAFDYVAGAVVKTKA